MKDWCWLIFIIDGENTELCKSYIIYLICEYGLFYRFCIPAENIFKQGCPEAGFFSRAQFLRFGAEPGSKLEKIPAPGRGNIILHTFFSIHLFFYTKKVFFFTLIFFYMKKLIFFTLIFFYTKKWGLRLHFTQILFENVIPRTKSLTIDPVERPRNSGI